MSMFYAAGSETTELSSVELQQGLFQALDSVGESRKVLCLPPDFTRYHSRAGELTRYAYKY